jgi:DNA-binding FadR family transcriptional regulator
MLTGAVLRALEARFATHKITDAALDQMAAMVDRLYNNTGDMTDAQLAREFDQEIEKAADNPTLRSLIQSLSIVGQERRTRAIESMRTHTDVGRSRLQGHRDILAALRDRDPDAVEQAFRRQAISGVELLLDEVP